MKIANSSPKYGVRLRRWENQRRLSSLSDGSVNSVSEFLNSMLVPNIYCVSKNDTDVAHYNFNAHQPILVILAKILLREYAIKCCFVSPHLLTNVSALLLLLQISRFK